MTATDENITSCEFYVEGMHCTACELVVEKSLKKHPQVKVVKADLGTQKVKLQSDFSNIDHLQNQLNKLLEQTGYKLHKNPPTKISINYSELITAFVIALVFVGLFILLQKLGIVNLVRANQVTLPFVFLIGVVASLSTCMAVVGGLVLSLSSSYAKANVKTTSIPLIQFHISRIIGFFLLGGVIGLIGSAFTLTAISTFILNLILFLTMVIMGINLLDIIPYFRKLQIRIPKALSLKVLNKNSNINKFTPVILGITTFFLPCGFTQSMQIYSLTTGNYITGAITMLVFALGTFPILALISIASIKLANGLQSKLFFRTAGFIVLFFSVFNFINSLVSIGLIQPFLNL